MPTFPGFLLCHHVVVGREMRGGRGERHTHTQRDRKGDGEPLFSSWKAAVLSD